MMKTARPARIAHGRSLAQPLAVRRVAPTPRTSPKATSDEASVADADRLRLNNLSPSAGARKKKKRKGRGMAAGQGGHCGFGMRGQKSRAGSGPRPGFEGGQTSLFRRLPKLRGIAGGMPKGRDKHVTINLADVAQRFKENETVNLKQLEGRSAFKVQGAERFMGLKILGEGELPFPLTIKAHAFSDGAVEKIRKAGGKVEVVPPARIKWTRAGAAVRLKAAGGKAPVKKRAVGERGRPRKEWDKKDAAGNPLPNAGRAATQNPTGHKKVHKKKLKPWMVIRNEKLKEQGVKLPPTTAPGPPKLGTHGGKQSQLANVAPKKKRTNQVRKKRVRINKPRVGKSRR